MIDRYIYIKAFLPVEMQYPMFFERSICSPTGILFGRKMIALCEYIGIIR